MMPIYSSPLKNVYIYVDGGIRRKYGDPYVYGSELADIMRRAAYNIIKEDVNLDPRDTLVIKILEGGKFYYISEALIELGYRGFEEASIDIKSRFRYDPKDIVTKVVDYGDVRDKIRGKSTVLMGETIASGSTMETFIDTLSNELSNIDRFIILGFHTWVGLERALKKLSKYGVEYTIYSYGGLLGLGPNKTDMSIGYNPSHVPNEVREYTYARLGKYVGDKLCVIGDFTYSFKYIDKYLAERVIQLRELFEDSPPSDRMKILSLIREGLSRMMNLGLSIDEVNERLNEEFRRRLKLVGLKPSREIDVEYVLNDSMFKT